MCALSFNNFLLLIGKALDRLVRVMSKVSQLSDVLHLRAESVQILRQGAAHRVQRVL
jgi:hypothetical protein